MDINQLIQSFIQHITAYNQTPDPNAKQQIKNVLDNLAIQIRNMGYDPNQFIPQGQGGMGQQPHMQQPYPQQSYMGQPQPNMGMGQPHMGQPNPYGGRPPMGGYPGYQQPMQHPGSNQPQPQGFGQPVQQQSPSFGQPNQQQMTRTRRKRAMSVNTTQQPTQPQQVEQVEQVIPEVTLPKGKEHRLTPILESGIDAKLVNAGDELIYVYRGESNMTDLVVKTLDKADKLIVTPPVPDINLMGDATYAELSQSEADMVYGNYIIAYTIFDNVSILSPLKMMTDKVKDMNIFAISELIKEDLRGGSIIANWINDKLTDYVNVILNEYLDTGIVIESFAEDIKELSETINTENDPDLQHVLQEVISNLTSILKEILSSDIKDEMDGDGIHTLHVNETYIRINNNILNKINLKKLIDDNEGRIGFTPDSAPHIYKVLEDAFNNRKNAFVYLLYNNKKYALYKLDTEKGILIKSVV